MGIFDFFFKKKEELEEHSISIDRLREWYEQQLKPKRHRLMQKVRQTKQKIIQNTHETRQKIQELENAKLMNPDIPERAKHFLQGNKEAYIKKINSFLDSIMLPEEIEELDGFIHNFNINIHNLAQGLARPTQILNEFLSNETRATALPLGKIEKNIDAIKELMQKLKIDQARQTKEKIQELQNRTAKEKELKEELRTATREINQARRENEQLAKEIELLQKNSEYNNAKEQKNQIKEKINQMQKELLDSFAVIETALKKYEHITLKHREILGKYLESPINALMNDFNLELVHMLADLKTNAESGKLEMKPKKTQKTMDEIKKLTKERLGRFLIEYGQLCIDERKMREKISQMDVAIVAQEKEKKKEKNLSMLNEKMSRINQIKTELSKIDIQSMTKELRKLLEEQCNVKLTISEEPLAQATHAPEQTQ